MGRKSIIFLAEKTQCNSKFFIYLRYWLILFKDPTSFHVHIVIIIMMIKIYDVGYAIIRMYNCLNIFVLRNENINRNIIIIIVTMRFVLL